MCSHRWRRWLSLPLIFLIIAISSGVCYLVDLFLSPRPTMCRVSEPLFSNCLEGPSSDLAVYSSHWDSSARWMCVCANYPNTSPDSDRLFCRVYDLESKGRLIWEYQSSTGDELAEASCLEGIRVVKKTSDSRVQVIEYNFAKQRQNILPVDIPLPRDLLRFYLINSGRQLAMIQRWPLWPWRLLMSAGYLPLDALFFRHANSELPHLTADGQLLTVYDVATGKKLVSTFLAPPVSNLPVISDDGRWLILPEVIAHQDTLFWQLFNPFAWKSRTGIPALPRGVRVVDLQTGLVRLLPHELTDELKEKQAGAFNASVEGDSVRVSYIKAVQDGTSRVFVFMPDATVSALDQSVNPKYDLQSGTKTNRSFPSFISLAPAHWAFDHSNYQEPWPRPLERFAQLFGVSLDSLWPLSFYSQTTFFDQQTNHPRYHFRKRTSPGKFSTAMPSADRHAVIVMLPGDDQGTRIYRWKVPFDIPSPWWSKLAGLTTFVILMLLWYRWQRRSTLVSK